ncbi:MAG: SUMF1/EgtB/PvdO family nonheme iron enzyme [Magnetococcus sp. YQC-9]
MNNKRPFFGTRGRTSRISGAVRKTRPGEMATPSRSSASSLSSWWSQFGKKIAIGLTALIAIGIIVLVLSARFGGAPGSGSSSTDAPSWQSCLMQTPEGGSHPDLLPVPAGEYRLHPNSQELKPFLVPHGLGKIQIKEPFLIEKHEVSLKAFRRYLASLDKMPAGPDRDRRKSHIGMHWNKDDAETASVKGISWEAAWDYADWLGQQTGCAYGLPSREQWGAAALLLDGARETVSKAGVLSSESLRRLLWGVREWSATPCAGGYYIVGEDDFVPLPEVRSATCMPAMLSVAGFRVVLKATGPGETKPGKVEKSGPPDKSGPPEKSDKKSASGEKP